MIINNFRACLKMFKIEIIWGIPCKQCCKKCDEDSHGNSISFSVTNPQQFGTKYHQIPWLFHVIYPGFICFPCWNMTWISGNFPGIFKENDGISIGFDVIFDQTAVKKTWENPRHIFYRVVHPKLTEWRTSSSWNDMRVSGRARKSLEFLIFSAVHI